MTIKSLSRKMMQGDTYAQAQMFEKGLNRDLAILVKREQDLAEKENFLEIQKQAFATSPWDIQKTENPSLQKNYDTETSAIAPAEEDEELDQEAVKQLRNVVYSTATKYFSQGSSKQAFEGFQKEFDDILQMTTTGQPMQKFSRFSLFSNQEKSVLKQALSQMAIQK